MPDQKLNPKNESLVSSLMSKLKGKSKDELFDIAGNPVGTLSNGKIVIDGVESNLKVIFDDEGD